MGELIIISKEICSKHISYETLFDVFVLYIPSLVNWILGYRKVSSSCGIYGEWICGSELEKIGKHLRQCPRCKTIYEV